MNIIYVKHIPDILKLDTLYISEEYQVAIHICPKCKRETVTPLNMWIWNKENRSMTPSILDKECGAHYYITGGQIESC